MRCISPVTASLAVVVSLAAIGAGGASAAAPPYKACGHLTVGGFGGPNPPGVPTGAKPHIEALRFKGTTSCATARNVMQKVIDTSVGTKPKSPSGWKCHYKSGQGYWCAKGTNEIGEATIYTLNGQVVGPRPKRP